MFWALISFISFLSIIILQALFIFLSGINPHIRSGIDLLSSAVALQKLSYLLQECLYVGMFYVYDNLGMLQVTTPDIANRLGYGVKLTTAPVVDVADL